MNKLIGNKIGRLKWVIVFVAVFLLCGGMKISLAQEEGRVDLNALTQAFRDVKRARVVVRQTYGEADEVSLPFHEYAEKILNYAGLSVVEEDATTYDATISIEAKGIPGSASYMGTMGGSHWTKATVEGKISFSAGDKIFRWDFSYAEGPYGTIHSSFPTPNDAPFQAAFNRGFIPAFFKAIAKVLGMPPLISALKDKEYMIRRAAAEALGELKDPRAVEPLISALKDEGWHVRLASARILGELKDPRAVEPLISALKDEDMHVRFWAVKALEEITGKNFGEDEAKWRDWLGEE